MQTAQLIHTTINGSDRILQTENLDGLLNNKNYAAIANLAMSEIKYFPDDLAVTYTVIMPEVEESTGRIYQKNNTIIAKFAPSELVGFLKPDELLRLLKRAEERTNLLNRMAAVAQNDGILDNPLPEVKL